MVQNCLMAFDLLTWKDEPRHKTSFVRLIGTHSTKFIMLIFTGFICVNAVLDGLLLGLENALLVCYLAFALWMLTRLMEEKQNHLQESWFAPTILILTLFFVQSYIQC